MRTAGNVTNMARITRIMMSTRNKIATMFTIRFMDGVTKYTLNIKTAAQAIDKGIVQYQ